MAGVLREVVNYRVEESTLVNGDLGFALDDSASKKPGTSSAVFPGESIN